MSSFFCNFELQYIYFFIWLLCFNFSFFLSFFFFFFFFGTHRSLEYTFLKNLSKMLLKKWQKYLFYCLKLFEYPVKMFNKFRPSFIAFFYSSLCCFKLCFFKLTHKFNWNYFSQKFSLKLYIYMYIYITQNLEV